MMDSLPAWGKYTEPFSSFYVAQILIPLHLSLVRGKSANITNYEREEDKIMKRDI